MHRYAETLGALTNALNLMVEEGDTLLVATIAHPLHLVEKAMMRRRLEIIRSHMPDQASPVQ